MNCPAGSNGASLLLELSSASDVLLADEPTGALDTTSGEAVLELLAAQCEQGRAVVRATHEPRFASFADRVIHLRDGHVVTANSRVTLEAVG